MGGAVSWGGAGVTVSPFPVVFSDAASPLFRTTNFTRLGRSGCHPTYSTVRSGPSANATELVRAAIHIAAARSHNTLMGARVAGSARWHNDVWAGQCHPKAPRSTSADAVCS